ncbi:MAG TPA: patatin-like phospholipase family protein [Nevskiaceae bacterium]|nr:patatin-like phospholipase family protein [Nevskiaceae bacterium]
MAFDLRPSRQRLAFVLAGGGSCGAAQVGMLRELVRAGIRPDLVVGSSVGALNGAWFAGAPHAAGVAQMEHVWRNLRSRDVFPWNFSSVLRLLRRAHSLVDAAPVRALLARHLPCARLEHCALPAHVVATDAISGEAVRLSHGCTVEAVLASIAIPAVLPPVVRDGRLLIDGGVACNTPVAAAVELGATHVLVLPTAPSYTAQQPPRSALEFGLHAVSLLLARNAQAQLAHHAARVPVLTLPSPDSLPVPGFEFSRSGELIECAAQSTRAWLDAGGLDAFELPALQAA